MSILSNNFYYQPLKIDSVNTQVYGDFIAKEGDANGRGLLVTLTENGLQKDTTGITLNLKWAHTTIAGLQNLDPFESVDLTKGLYKITYPTDMLRKGRVDAFIQIIDSGSVIGSRNIKINVEATVGDDTAIESSNEFRALASALVEVQGWNARIDDVEQEFIDKANNLDATYPTRLVSVETGLEQEKVNYSKENTNRNPTPSLVAHKTIKPLVTFIDDDGAIEILTKLKPLSETHGIPFVSALIGSYTDVNAWSLTTAQALDLQDNLGWEIASHEYMHIPLNDLQYTEEDYQYELKYSAEFLRAKGLNIKNMVYPYGRYNNRIKEITAQVYNCGVGTDTGINTTPLQTYQLKRLAFPGTAPNNTLAWYKAQVDTAVATNGWLIWMLHCGQAVHTVEQQAILNDLIVYIKSINVDIVTIQEALDNSGNVIATNDNKYYLAADGKNNIVNYANVPINTQTGTELINADMLPNQFEYGKTYVSQIYNSTAKAKFPPNEAGVFTCVMTDNYANSYQTFITKEKSYKRMGIGATTWGTWIRLVEATQGVVTLAETVIPANSAAFKSFSTSYFEYLYIPIFTPKVLFPSGVIFSVRHTGGYGTWNITMYNPTAAEVTVPAGDWAYMLLKI